MLVKAASNNDLSAMIRSQFDPELRQQTVNTLEDQKQSLENRKTKKIMAHATVTPERG